MPIEASAVKMAGAFYYGEKSLGQDLPLQGAYFSCRIYLGDLLR
jgi:hypothetical protein